MYADFNYYKDIFSSTDLTEDTAKIYLEKASQKVDSLTFNRIIGKGFENLTSFQQKIIKDTVCYIANYDYSNNDNLGNGLSSYSINGVSMNFDKSDILTVNGIEIKKNTYSILEQSGLTCRRF